MYNIKHPPSCPTLTCNTFLLKVNMNYAAMIVFIFFKIWKYKSVLFCWSTMLCSWYKLLSSSSSSSLLLLLLLLYDMYVSCHRHFLLVLFLNQRSSPPLRFQASHCSIFRIMCDVPSIAVFCSESIECFPGIVSKFFFKLLVTIPVAQIITGTIVHLRFHIRCISIHKLLYFNVFSTTFCTTFLSAGIATSITVHVYSFLFYYYYYYYDHHHLLYAGYLYLYSRDKLFP